MQCIFMDGFGVLFGSYVFNTKPMSYFGKTCCNPAHVLLARYHKCHVYTLGADFHSTITLSPERGYGVTISTHLNQYTSLHEKYHQNQYHY